MENGSKPAAVTTHGSSCLQPCFLWFHLTPVSDQIRGQRLDWAKVSLVNCFQVGTMHVMDWVLGEKGYILTCSVFIAKSLRDGSPCARPAKSLPMAVGQRRASSSPQPAGPKVRIRTVIMTPQWFSSCCVSGTVQRPMYIMCCKLISTVCLWHRYHSYLHHTSANTKVCQRQGGHRAADLSCRQLSCMGADWNQRGPGGHRVAACRTRRYSSLNLCSATCARDDMGQVGAVAVCNALSVCSIISFEAEVLKRRERLTWKSLLIYSSLTGKSCVYYWRIKTAS